jgi:hypothetical protein
LKLWCGLQGRTGVFRLLTKLVLRVTDTAEHVWAWSCFPRRRQHQARLSHYRRRGSPLT